MGSTVRATLEYPSEGDDQLGYKEDDIIRVISTRQDGWWLAMHTDVDERLRWKALLVNSENMTQDVPEERVAELNELTEETATGACVR